jgi:hypothetical protein
VPLLLGYVVRAFLAFGLRHAKPEAHQANLAVNGNGG